MKTRLLPLSFALLLSAALLSSCGGDDSNPSSQASKATTSADTGNFTIDYFVEADGWLIEDYHGNEEKVFIPEFFEHDGKTLPITGVYKNAFYGRSSVKEVIAGENVSYIGEGAFDNTNIESFIATPRLVHVSEASFRGSKLSFLSENGAKYIPSEDNPHCIAFAGEEGVKLHEDTKSVADHAFEDIGGNIPLPKGIQSIGDTKMGTFTLEALGTELNLLHIGQCALANSKVVSLDLSRARGRVGDYAFYGCSALTSLTLGPDVSEIGKYAFYATTIEDIIIPENIRYLDEGAFALHKGKSLVIGNNLQEVESGIFDMSTFSSVSLPYRFADKILSTSAFIEIGNLILDGEGDLPKQDYSSRGIKKITLKGKPTKIPEGFASHFKNVSAVNLSMKLKDMFKLENRMELYLKPNLTVGLFVDGSETETTSITLPSGITAIPEYVFSGCKNLTEATLPESVEEIGAYAFYDSGLRSIHLPASLKTIREYAFDCTPDSYSRKTRDSKVEDVYIERTYESWMALRGKENLEDVDNVHLLMGGEELTSLTVPEGTTSIPKQAFVRCTGIKTITLPQGLTTLEDRCLCWTGATTLTLPKSIAHIGESAIPFSLTELIFEGSSAEWLEIDRNTFWDSGSSISVIKCSDGEIPAWQRK